MRDAQGKEVKVGMRVKYYKNTNDKVLGVVESIVGNKAKILLGVGEFSKRKFQTVRVERLFVLDQEDPLNSLKIHATNVAAIHGHALNPWKDDGTTKARTNCNRCGGIIFVDLNPPANGVEVRGEPSVLDCTYTVAEVSPSVNEWMQSVEAYVADAKNKKHPKKFRLQSAIAAGDTLTRMLLAPM